MPVDDVAESDSLVPVSGNHSGVLCGAGFSKNRYLPGSAYLSDCRYLPGFCYLYLYVSDIIGGVCVIPSQ